MMDEITSLREQLAAAQATNERLREALKFYMVPPIGQLNDHCVSAAKLGMAALALPAIEPVGEVIATTTEEGRCVCVTLQDEEGRILKVLWEAPAIEPAPQQEPNPVIPVRNVDSPAVGAAPLPDAQLCQFYDVDNFPDLVSAMDHHIEKLQSKLPPTPSLWPGRVREG